MINALHRKLGTAGFVISIVALVMALGGGAYAASGGLTGKQKKEVETIAKKFAGKPGKPGAVGPTGPVGTTGATGPTGAKGDTGLRGETGDQGIQGGAGEAGTPGAKGDKGESVNVVPLSSSNGSGHCEEGGAKFVNGTGEAYACNGAPGGGGGGTYPETLPAGRSETGYLEVLGSSGVKYANLQATVSTISFPLPLATEPTETILLAGTPSEEEEDKCPGKAAEPKAAAGILCLYTVLTEVEGEALELKFGSASTSGAALFFKESNKGIGTWAVTAK